MLHFRQNLENSTSIKDFALPFFFFFKVDFKKLREISATSWHMKIHP